MILYEYIRFERCIEGLDELHEYYFDLTTNFITVDFFFFLHENSTAQAQAHRRKMMNDGKKQ